MNEVPRPSDVPPSMIKHIRPWDKWPGFPRLQWIEPGAPCGKTS